MLSWLDTNSSNYWLVALVALTVTFALAIWPAVVANRRFTSYALGAFNVMLLLTLLAGRWPLLFISQSLEFDESGLINAARTAAVDPAPWAAFDPQTSGPLNVYALALPRFFGFPIGYNSAHAVAIILIWIMLASLVFVARRYFADAIARLSVLPALIFFAFAFNGEFEHYASELLSLTLLSLALVTATASIRSNSWNPWLGAVTGILIGALPFAKLQSLILSAFLFASIVVALRLYPRLGSVRYLAGLLCGTLAVPFLFFLSLIVTRSVHDFVMSYIRMPAAYVSGDSAPLSFIFSDPHYSTFIFTSVAIVLALLCLLPLTDQSERAPAPQRWATSWAFCLLAVSFYTVFAPHKGYTHYVLYLVPAFVALLASAAGSFESRLQRARSRYALLIVLVAAVVLLTVPESVNATEPYLGHVRTMMTSEPRPIIAFLRGELRPGDRVAVWGLDPDIAVQSGAVLGTRDFHDKFQMERGPLQAYYLQRFINDIATTRPAFFVDAVAPGAVEFSDQAKSGYQTIPLLASLINKRYELLRTINGIRVFALRSSPAFARDTSYARNWKPQVAPTSRPDDFHGALRSDDVAHLTVIPGVQAEGSIDGISTTEVQGTPPYRFPAGAPLSVNGWAVDPRSGSSAEGLVLVIDGHTRIDASSRYGFLRPDVAAALHNQRSKYSGFIAASAPTSGLKPGLHRLQFGTVSSDGHGLYLSAPTSFSIR